MPAAVTYTAHRYHDISVGHRVYGHENKCAKAHGHNLRVHFYCQAELDVVGRVMDFSVMKSRLCMWLEDNWDHRFLLDAGDPWLETMRQMDESVVALPVNPTCENLAAYLLTVVGPQRLEGTGVRLVEVVVEETRKCSARASLVVQQ